MNPQKILNDIQTATEGLQRSQDSVEREIAANLIRARARDLIDWANAQLTQKEEPNERA